MDMWSESLTFDRRACIYLTRLSVLLIILAGVYTYAPNVTYKLALNLYRVGELEARIDAYDEMVMYYRYQRIAREEEHERVRSLLAEYERANAFRAIKTPNIENVASSGDKLIVADLSAMRLHLYDKGDVVRSFDVVSKGKNGSRWETPAGLYGVETKELDHFSSIGEVHMPYSMQFFGNFFIHGWPYYPNGSPVARGYSGGCIRLETVDAGETFAFADKNTPLFVFDVPDNFEAPLVSIKDRTTPADISAEAFIVADVNTGRVYLEKKAGVARPIASITKLMTALVGNEVIHYDNTLSLAMKDRQYEGDFGALSPGDRLTVGEALYPLLMESNNAVAHALARQYGVGDFLEWMQVKASALGMEHTSFGDASGISADNSSTPDDVFRLARYLYMHQSFILGVTRTLEKKIKTSDGRYYSFKNFNHFANDNTFLGGKTGFTNAAGETMVSLFEVPVENSTTTLGIVVLGSKDREGDTIALRNWFKNNSHIDKQAQFPKITVTGNEAAVAATFVATRREYRAIPVNFNYTF